MDRNPSSDNRIDVRFRHEWHDDDGRWWRGYGDENREFYDDGYMRMREASINDAPVREDESRTFGSRSEEGLDLAIQLLVVPLG